MLLNLRRRAKSGCHATTLLGLSYPKFWNGSMRSVNVTKEPVRLFNMIAIETASLCNRHCVFCPNHTTARPDELMNDVMIERIISQLEDMKYAGCITWYLYNEPLRDKRLLDIVRRVDARLPRACQSINTNGDYLKRPEQLKALFDAGLRQVVINVYSAQDGVGTAYQQANGVAQAKARADRFDGWIRDLQLEPRGSMYTHVPRGARYAKVERKYGLQEGSTRIGSFEMQNRSGNISWFQAELAEPLAKMCVRPFRFMNVNWKGDVILCCNDYHADIKFGNVMAEPLVDIWNSDQFNAYRVALLAKDRDIALCRNCDYSGGSYPHMVESVSFGSKAANKRAVEGIRKL
jgi:radical SAM protein with 4Fe4S-binding SPASM domain